jgi:hypothetical protein
VLWPLLAVALMLILVAAPAWASYRRRETATTD